jgi:carbon starvation protein CstA
MEAKSRITIACGAVSGFHSLISSGTTPKMLENETHARFFGYGGMLAESFVAVMALVAASCIQPGVYFAMNSPAALVGTTPEAQTLSTWGFVITPDVLTQTAKDVGENTILARADGAPTLAVGVAHILHQVVGGNAMMALWYHFEILFEALFILTAVDAGTRAGRFMLQDLLGTFVPALKRTESLPANLTATALLLCTVVLFRMKKDRCAWVTIAPACWLLVCTLTLGWQKIFAADPKVGFLAHANRYADALAQGQV